MLEIKFYKNMLKVVVQKHLFVELIGLQELVKMKQNLEVKVAKKNSE